MGAGSGMGSHARLNNGYPFRTDKGFAVLVAYFANRKTSDGYDRLDYSGHVLIDANDQESTAKKFCVRVEFLRKWFGPGVPRTINLGALQLDWTAPNRKVKFDDTEGSHRDDPVDTFLTVSLNDGPLRAHTAVGQGIVGPVYGIYATDNEQAAPLDELRVLEDVPPPDNPAEVAMPLTLTFRYTAADLNGLDDDRLGVVRWMGDGFGQSGQWCRVAEEPDSRQPEMIRVKVTQLTTWYALGIDFPECTYFD
jgi:hypothetical protein